MAFRNVASYSHSKSKMMGVCPLMYWRYTYGSWNGWWRSSKPPKNERAGEMYAAKHIESVPIWRGKLVHVAAERALKASMEGRKWSDNDGIRHFMLQRTRSMFGRQMDQALYQKTGSPKHRLILAELVRDDIVDFDEVWQSVESRINALTASDESWSGLNVPMNLFTRAINQPKRIVLVEDLVSFQHAGLTVWLATDLIMRSPKDNRRCVIVDWKTGKKRKIDRMQMEVYGAWCTSKGWTSADGVIAYVGEDGVEVDYFEITEEMTSDANDRIEMFAEDLKDRLVNGDLERNEPILDKFESTDNPYYCGSCMFADICEREGTKP